MSIPSYPYFDLEGGRLLLAQLGSFWTRIFKDTKVLQEHLRSSGNEQSQTYLKYLEAVATVSRLTVPIFHTENWYLLTVRESEAEDLPSVYKEGDLVYGPQTGAVEGRPEGFVQTYGGRDRPDVFQIPLPETMRDAQWTLQNTVVLPSRVWVYGVDYTIDRDRNILRFAKDPFADPAVAIRDVLDSDGTVTDREIGLWVYRGSFDQEYIWTYFGYVLSIKLKSSEEYKAIVNALWDMYVLGPSLRGFQSFMAAAVGAPTIIDASETVEVVRTEGETKLVVTTTHSYRVPASATVIVSVGDVLKSGDPITDAVQISELCGANPDYSLLTSLAVSPSFTTTEYLCELIFRNEQVALEYLGPDDDGRVMVRFEVSGFPADVELFWEKVHASGKASGATLAELLDQRTNKVGQPPASALPAYVNPLEMVVGNIMRNNLFVIRMNEESFGENAPGSTVLSFLRNVIPPHTTYVVLYQFGSFEEEIDLAVDGAEEGIGLWLGPGIITEEVDETSYEDAAISVHHVTPWCQSEGG
jgi:hypothetical protein